MKVIDQTNDPGFSVLRIVVDKFPQLREFSKTANLDTSEFSELPDNAFAWPGQRRFPIHNAEHAALSLGYSKIATRVPSDVTEMMEKAAVAYGIDAAMFETSIEKVASDDGTFLLSKEKRFRVDGPQDIPEIENVILEKYATLSINNRAEACMRLVEVSQQHNVPLKPCTYKLAGFTMTSTQTLRDAMENRRALATKLGSMVASAYQKIADHYRGVEPIIFERTEQLKLASLVNDLDQQANLVPYYNRKISDPIQTVFNMDERREDYVKFASAFHNKDLLAQLPLSFWEDALGPEIVSEIAPNGAVDVSLLEQVLSTLPADVKLSLENQLAAYNR